LEIHFYSLRKAGNGAVSEINKRRQPMFTLIKKLFKSEEKATVLKNGKTYRFKTFEQAVAFMMM
jgi:hypothetical protein